MREAVRTARARSRRLARAADRSPDARVSRRTPPDHRRQPLRRAPPGQRDPRRLPALPASLLDLPSIQAHPSHRQQQLELVCHCARSGRPSGSTVISCTPSSMRAPPRWPSSSRSAPTLSPPPRGGATRPSGGASSGPSRRSPCLMAADLLRCSVRKVRSAPPHQAAAVPPTRTCPGPDPRD
jgi:hypothetical protein